MSDSVNEWKYLNKFLERKIDDFAPEVKSYLGEIQSFNGQFAEVKLINNDDSLPSLIIKNVLICENPYFKPMVRKGDKGVLINLHNSIYAEVIGKKTQFSLSPSYLFLPVVTSSQIISSDGDALEIVAPSKGTKVKLNDEGLDFASNSTIKIGVNEDSSKIELSGGGLKIESNTPLTLQVTDTLGSILTELIEALIAFQSTPTAPGSPCGMGADTLQKLNDIKSKVGDNFK